MYAVTDSRGFSDGRIRKVLRHGNELDPLQLRVLAASSAVVAGACLERGACAAPVMRALTGATAWVE